MDGGQPGVRGRSVTALMVSMRMAEIILGVCVCVCVFYLGHVVCLCCAPYLSVNLH